VRHSGWATRRAGARARLLAALTALSFTITVLITGILGLVDSGSVDGVRQYLAGVDDTAAVSQFSTSLANDPAAQEAAVRALTAVEFGGLPVRQYRRLKSLPYTVNEPASGGERTDTVIRLGSYDDFAAHARITSGRWPDPGGSTAGGSTAGGSTAGSATAGSATAVAVPQPIARQWRLTVGDRLQAKGTAGALRTLEVAAVFAPDPGPFWRADVALVNEQSAADLSPTLVVSEAALTAAGGSPSVGWIFQVAADQISPEQVGPLRRAFAGLPDVVRRDFTVSVNGALFAGDLAGSLAVLQGSLDAAVVAQPLPIMLIVAFGLVMVLQIGRLITDDRRSETALLKSRGLSAGRLSRWAAVEAILFAVPGALLGVAASALLTAVPVAGWWTALAVVLVALVACTVPAWRDGVATLIRSRIDDSGRGAGAVAGGALVLLAAAAAFAVWRFRRSGADAVRDVGGRRVLDPAVLLAPPVVLVALSAAGLVLFGLAGAVAERLAARRSTALTTVLPARQLARRRAVFGTAVMLIAMAVGGLCVAAGYASTTARHQQVTARLGNGADIRVATPAGDLSAYAGYRDPAARYAALPAVTAAGTVQRLDTAAGDTPVTLVGIGARGLEGLTRPAPRFDPAAQAAVLGSGADSGAPLPSGATTLTLRGTVNTGNGGAGSPASVQMPVTGWLLTPDGALAPTLLGVAKIPLNSISTFELRAPLPGLRPGTRLVGIDLPVTGNTADPLSYQVLLDVRAGSAAGEQQLIAKGWGVRPLGEDTTPFQNAAEGRLGFTVVMPANDSGQHATLPVTARLLAPDAGPKALTVVADQALAGRLDLRVGDRLSLTIPGITIRAQIGAIVPQLAGFDSGAAVALADLPSLGMTLLRSTQVIPQTTEVWLASSDPAATRQAAIAAAGPVAAVTQVGEDAVEALLRPAGQALWWGMGGALLLGALSVLLVTATQARSRRAEAVVLRALGVHAGEQAAMRRRELLSTVLPAWVLGLAAGFGTALLIVPGLARQAVVGGSATQNPPLLVQWPLWGVLLAGHIMLVLLTIGWHGFAIRRHARVADPREVTA